MSLAYVKSGNNFWGFVLTRKSVDFKNELIKNFVLSGMILQKLFVTDISVIPV